MKTANNRRQSTAMVIRERIRPNEQAVDACLNPSHRGRTAVRWGLCESCYQTAAAMIRRRDTTLEELVKRGKALPQPLSIKAWLTS